MSSTFSGGVTVPAFQHSNMGGIGMSNLQTGCYHSSSQVVLHALLQMCRTGQHS